MANADRKAAIPKSMIKPRFNVIKGVLKV